MKRKTRFYVQSGEWERFNYPAEVEIDLKTEAFNSQNLRLIEEDAHGKLLDDSVPFQFDQNDGGTASLTFMLKGGTPSHTQRYYALIGSDKPQFIKPLVQLDDGVIHQEQESYRIQTPVATYFYHKLGAGFASIYDLDGHDWLSYRPYGGSDGKYRGIPNLAHPENHFHPGGTGCKSGVNAAGPLKIKIASESLDGDWACTWEIYPAFIRLTVLKVGHPYWFLYEGTPGGELDEAGDYCVRSDGTRLALTERWDSPLPTPEWIYFGASNTKRVLFFVHHEADDLMDSFWPMEHNMTVFGFGRKGIEKFMTQTPSQFTVGFSEDNDFEAVDKLITSAFRPLDIVLE